MAGPDPHGLTFQKKQRRPKVQNLVTQRTAGRILIEPAAQRLQMLTSRRKKKPGEKKSAVRLGAGGGSEHGNKE